MIYNSILEAQGHTPLVRLQRMVPQDCAQVLVKYEGLNIGGSIKTRTAYNMICDAEKKGILNKNSVIIEPTSGNTGIGIAAVAAARGYRKPNKHNQQNLLFLHILNAKTFYAILDFLDHFVHLLKHLLLV